MLFAREKEFNREILAASQATGVPVSVLKGFIAAESAFNPKAYRAEPQIGDASYGLSQILYRTAKGLGYPGEPAALADPSVNTLYGAKYIRLQLERYPDLTQSIASYNMGFPRRAGATTPAIIRIYGEPRPEWVYANQPYVDRVASFVAYYQALEKPDLARAAKVEALIKKKDTISARAFLKNPLFPSGVAAPPASPGS